jgi:glycine/serine hydroxymethyltransferase
MPQINCAAIYKLNRSLGTYTVIDVTKIAGLVVCGLAASPFENADVVIVGMRGSMPGPSGALIFSRTKELVHRTDVKDTDELRSLPT